MNLLRKCKKLKSLLTIILVLIRLFIFRLVMISAIKIKVKQSNFLNLDTWKMVIPIELHIHKLTMLNK